MIKSYNKNKKIYIDIYCKIYTDTFNNDIYERLVSGQEIFDFLMKDSGHAFDSNGNKILGDCNMWYLGCNEKFGNIQYGNNVIEWGHGESSFDNVEKFVKFLYEEGMITKNQFKILSYKINEGRRIDCMYDISDYLICKQDGKQWIKTKDSETFRSDFKKMLGNVKKSFEEKSYKVLNVDK